MISTGVVTHVHCDTPRGSTKPRCEFGLDTRLCLSYQFYAPFIISKHRTGAFKASCPSGTVLTGLALLGNRHDHGRRRDGTQISEDPAGAMPRCGALSGYRLKQSINGTSHDGTTRVLVANTKFEACRAGPSQLALNMASIVMETETQALFIAGNTKR